MLKTAIKKIQKLFKKAEYKISSFENYKDYIEIQYRCPPKEFLDARLKIVSSFVYILPELEKNDITSPVTHKKEAIANQLMENKISILDVGSRDGWVIEFLNSLGYTNVIGIELHKEYVDYCRKKGRNVILGDVHNLKFDNESFDFIYCRHVLEHCLDPIKVLSELLRVAKEKGAIYCSFPMQEKVFGKHTTAIPNLRTVNKILKNIDYNFHPIYIGKAINNSFIIPEGNEAIIFIIKGNVKSK